MKPAGCVCVWGGWWFMYKGTYCASLTTWHQIWPLNPYKGRKREPTPQTKLFSDLYRCPMVHNTNACIHPAGFLGFLWFYLRLLEEGSIVREWAWRGWSTLKEFQKQGVQAQHNSSILEMLLESWTALKFMPLPLLAEVWNWVLQKSDANICHRKTSGIWGLHPCQTPFSRGEPSEVRNH